MANKRSIESIYSEIKMVKEKIHSYQLRLEKLEKMRVEMENLQIVEKVRAIYLTPQELAHFLKDGFISEKTSNETYEREDENNEVL